MVHLMSKLVWIVILIAAAWVVDESLNHGYYTDGALRMFSHMRRSFHL